MEKMFDLREVKVEGHRLSFQVNGVPVICDLSQTSPIFARANAEQIARVVADPVGVGFHWPELDEDLSVNGILRDLGIHLPSEKTKLVEKLQLA